MDRVDLAARIGKTCSLRGEFRLRSGQASDRYLDKYLFEAEPRLVAEIAEIASYAMRAGGH